MKQKPLKLQLFKLGIFILLCLIFETSSTPCELRVYETGNVCVCNSSYCDTLEFDLPEIIGEVLIVSTSKKGLHFKKSTGQFNGERFEISDHQWNPTRNPRSDERNLKINFTSRAEKLFNPTTQVFINHNETFQKIVGFGNSLTGAVSHNLKLVPSLQDQIFKSYFSKQTGNGFNMIRTPIGGCDFDLEPWAYNELPRNDRTLKNFTQLDARDFEKVKFLQKLVQVSHNADIKLIGSAWSSPKWMKTNGEWTGFSSLKDEYYQTWADYHVKYLELMHQANINFWAITTGNEPLNGVSAFLFIKFMSLGWLPKAQGKWISENLGPSLKKSLLLSNVKILAGDDQRYTFPWWFDQMYNAYPQSKTFVDGHAVHWYWDKYVTTDELDKTRRKYPEKLIIATEACSGDKPWEEHRPMLGYWSRGEDYAIDIIEDLNHHVNAWIDWNMILNESGGPNYANNFVDSPIVVNSTSKEEFYKQPTFYAMGHFSRFLVSDSVRVASKSSSKSIKSTAFLRPDGFKAVVLYNSANHAADVDINDSIRGVFKLTFPAKSIHTLLFK